MKRFIVQQQIGEGTFGTVNRAIKKRCDDRKQQQHTEFAIKRLKREMSTWDDVISLREVQAILALSACSQYLVKVHEILLESDSSLLLVCEYMPDGNLSDLIQTTLNQGRQLNESIIQSITFQALSGLHHIHSNGYIHRDLKPENLLLRKVPTFKRKCKRFGLNPRHQLPPSNRPLLGHRCPCCPPQRPHDIEEEEDDDDMMTTAIVCKISDFSLARAFRIKDSEKKMTSYVSTRWYRAPEIILCSPSYSSKVDIFAMGCIIPELYRLLPIFPGNGDVDQLRLILKLLASQGDGGGNGEDIFEDWEEGRELFTKLGMQLKLPTQQQQQHGIGNGLSSSKNDVVRDRLHKEMKTASVEAIELTWNLLHLNPDRRFSAQDALQHRYLLNCRKQQVQQEGTIVPTPTLANRAPPEVDSMQVDDGIKNHNDNNDGNLFAQGHPKLQCYPIKSYKKTASTPTSADRMDTTETAAASRTTTSRHLPLVSASPKPDLNQYSNGRQLKVYHRDHDVYHRRHFNKGEVEVDDDMTCRASNITQRHTRKPQQPHQQVDSTSMNLENLQPKSIRKRRAASYTPATAFGVNF